MFAKNSSVKKEANRRKFTLLKTSTVVKNVVDEVEDKSDEAEEVQNIKYNYSGDFSGKDKTIGWLKKHGFIQSETESTCSESQEPESKLETVSVEKSQEDLPTPKIPKKDIMSDLKEKYPSLKKIRTKDDMKKPDVQIARLVTKIGRSISDTQHEVSALAKENKTRGVTRTYKDIMESISSIKASIKSTEAPILSTPPSLRKSKDFIAHKTSSINKRLDRISDLINYAKNVKKGTLVQK